MRKIEDIGKDLRAAVDELAESATFKLTRARDWCYLGSSRPMTSDLLAASSLASVASSLASAVDCIDAGSGFGPISTHIFHAQALLRECPRNGPVKRACMSVDGAIDWLKMHGYTLG